MGITCTLILLDEFDWGYVGTSWEQQSKDFVKEFGGYFIAHWYGAMVFDIDKLGYCSDERKAIIHKYCDTAYYILDTSLYQINKIE